MNNRDFQNWCSDNRWSSNLLSAEFLKYGVKIAPSTIHYWRSGKYKPSEQEYIEVLSKICGFDANVFFKKEG